MLARRIIPCLDVKNGQVVKGVQFKDHQVLGEIEALAHYYDQQGADELVFYDITASCDGRTVDSSWVKKVAEQIRIPFCVAGGICSIHQAEQLLNAGADKISINTPALENPQLISDLVTAFGQQCVVVGVDSLWRDEAYWVCQYTGDPNRSQRLARRTLEWVVEIQERGAGEIVLNCMNQDGCRQGFDIAHCQAVRACTRIPLIASGGAGLPEHFAEVFSQAGVDGALAASVFHTQAIQIPTLKTWLSTQNIEVRQ